MIHPSYVELMQVVNNENAEIGEEPVVNSRYSIVIATAKRARQIIGGDDPMIAKAAGKKPLSIAVQELYEGKVKIMGEDDLPEDEVVLASIEEASLPAADAEAPAGTADALEPLEQSSQADAADPS